MSLRRCISSLNLSTPFSGFDLYKKFTKDDVTYPFNSLFGILHPVEEEQIVVDSFQLPFRDSAQECG